MLGAARSAGLLDERGDDVWVRAAEDSMRTDGLVTFVVPVDAFSEIVAAAERELGPARTTLDAEESELVERIARRFGLPAELHPLDGGPLEVHARHVKFPGWRDFALLSRERRRTWFFRVVQDDE